ncbi:MAG: serine hydrolase domain-containing protein [Saprospiraceae bacterium]|nr:beta-lactamase family protein [Lewinella sp.]
MTFKKLWAPLVLVLICSCTPPDITDPLVYACDPEITLSNPEYPGHEQLQLLLNERVRKGVPGMMLTVKGPEGEWSGAAGKADLEIERDLEACQITRVGSTVKTFTAVSVLLLQEDGKLDLDDPVSHYLPAEELKGLRNAEQATVRQLLQHSSGIYNYIVNLEFQTASLNDLTRVWQPEELLQYARDKPANFPPGTDVAYSNTNYVLLGMIIEQVSGQPFYEFFEERLFLPFGLKFTQFAAIDPVPENIVHGYVDLYSKLNVIDATQYSGWDYFTADGGLISNAFDLATFLQALFEGKILQASSLEEMMQWQLPKDSSDDLYDTAFGLGIFRMNTPYGPAYMHSGDAIGYYAAMFYFPSQQLAVSWAVNGNYGKIDQFTQTAEAMDHLFKHIL